MSGKEDPVQPPDDEVQFGGGRGHRRTWWLVGGAAIVVAAVVLLLVIRQQASPPTAQTPAAGPTATVSATPGPVPVKASLDGGAVIVRAGPAPVMPRATALRLFHASVAANNPRLAKSAHIAHVYHGQLMVRPNLWPSFDQQPGWVIVYRVMPITPLQCDSRSMKPKSSSSPNDAIAPSGRSAFVVTDSRSVAFTYHEVGSGACSPARKPSANPAFARRSVAWTLVSREDKKAKIRYTLPPCGLPQGGGVTAVSNSSHHQSVRVMVKVPIGDAECGNPSTQETMTVHLLNPKELLRHGPTGTYGIDPDLP